MLAGRLERDKIAMRITIEISPGELVDRATILRLKSAHITDLQKKAIVSTELARYEAGVANLPQGPALGLLVDRLFAINAKLWEIEDTLRNCERLQDFGPAFVQLARDVYRTNDERFRIKRAIDELLGSAILEVKSYGGQ